MVNLTSTSTFINSPNKVDFPHILGVPRKASFAHSKIWFWLKSALCTANRQKLLPFAKAKETINDDNVDMMIVTVHLTEKQTVLTHQ